MALAEIRALVEEKYSQGQPGTATPQPPVQDHDEAS
jgi:hypothetical protein